MFGFLKKIFGSAPVAETKTEQPVAPYKVEAPVAPAPVVEAVPERAKDATGKFVADNPATPENEAWVGGQAPARKPAAIKAAKKPAAKKPAQKKAPARKKAAK
jgi:hypothetical protein